MDAPGSKAALRDLEAAALAEQQVLRGHPDVLEGDFCVAVRGVVVAVDRQRALDLHPRGMAGHDDHGLLSVPRGVLIGLAHEDEDLATRIAGAGGPPLAPVQHVVVSVALYARADVGRVGRGHIRLRHAERGANFALQQRHEPLPLDLLARVAHERLHVAGVWCRAIERLGPDARAAHQLAQRRVFQVGQAGAVLALGQEQVPQPSRLRLRLQRLDDRRRLPSVSLADLARRERLVGEDVLIHESAHARVQIACAFGHFEDHSEGSRKVSPPL